jgi:purine-nucleoside phosphorylase
VHRPDDRRAAEGGVGLTDDLDAAVDAVRARTDVRPQVGVVLGSGLGDFADAVEDAVVVPYAEIPGWPVSTAVGHAGLLVVGTFGGVPVAVLKGRAHLYEGHPAAKVAFGVRVLGRLGARSLVLTNASGALDAAVAPGTLVVISDHLNLQGASPLVGPNDESLGPRFPDMSGAYDPAYRALAHEAASRLGLALGEGVYAGWLGPAFETPAEIRMLRVLGADLVGMSTVAEVLAARHMGMRCLALSCVTNAAAGVLDEPIDHERVLDIAAASAVDLVALLREAIPLLGS